MSKKVLVAYATKMGATATIAAVVGAELRTAGHQVDVREIGAAPAVSEYDAVVLGSAIYRGRWRPEAVRFLRDHERQLRNRQVWLFHSGPIGPSKNQNQPLPPDVARLAHLIHPNPPKTFAGDLQAEAVAGIGAHREDLEHLIGDSRDWPEIHAWSDGIATALRTAVVQP
ncbi:flavodoxin domain-containing protein [Kribbella sp. NBC_00709]|uniref:flavodoxin domain-containing protein n=1 Tax=Kribbella sp. NBC_00709 TaxID=2975972 RepID=UPI002E2C00E3|nr:flavodoxin domain-containing protein [Kribbella sp. NBC_00709]